MHTGDALDQRIEALDVLHVDGGEHVNLRVQQLDHVFIALGVFAAFNVGVREFVNQRHRRLAGEDRIHIHFGEDGAFVFDLLARNHVHFRNQIDDALAAVGFDHAHHDVLAAAVAADAFAEHAVGFAHAGRVSEEDFEDARLLFRGGLFQPLFRTFLHESIVIRVLRFVEAVQLRRETCAASLC